MTERLVMAAWAWPTNAHLIEDVAKLGYLRVDDHVLDPTYGRGVWWRRWQPNKLTWHRRADDGTDYRHLDLYDGESFDAIAFDPPYVCPGGRSTSTIQEMHGRYGMNEGGFDDPGFRTPEELLEMNKAGLREMARLVRPSAVKKVHPTRPNGVILVKCKDYISSGAYFPSTHFLLEYAYSIGLFEEDRFEHIGVPGPQSQETQQHARRNLSTLLVLRKPRGWAPPEEEPDIGYIPGT